MTLPEDCHDEREQTFLTQMIRRSRCGCIAIGNMHEGFHTERKVPYNAAFKRKHCLLQNKNAHMLCGWQQRVNDREESASSSNFGVASIESTLRLLDHEAGSASGLSDSRKPLS